MGDVMGFILDWSGEICYTDSSAFSIIYLTLTESAVIKCIASVPC